MMAIKVCTSKFPQIRLNCTRIFLYRFYFWIIYKGSFFSIPSNYGYILTCKTLCTSLLTLHYTLQFIMLVYFVSQQHRSTRSLYIDGMFYILVRSMKTENSATVVLLTGSSMSHCYINSQLYIYIIAPS